MPPSETPYVYSAINENSFSSHTKTKIGLTNNQSPWFKNLKRYYTVLNPGDILINTPWFWHAIENLGEKGSNELIIGAPARYLGGASAFRSNLLYSLNMLTYMVPRHGLDLLKSDFKFDLQKDVTNDRRSREGKPLK